MVKCFRKEGSRFDRRCGHRWLLSSVKGQESCGFSGGKVSSRLSPACGALRFPGLPGCCNLKPFVHLALELLQRHTANHLEGAVAPSPQNQHKLPGLTGRL